MVSVCFPQTRGPSLRHRLRDPHGARSARARLALHAAATRVGEDLQRPVSPLAASGGIGGPLSREPSSAWRCLAFAQEVLGCRDSDTYETALTMGVAVSKFRGAVHTNYQPNARNSTSVMRVIFINNGNVEFDSNPMYGPRQARVCSLDNIVGKEICYAR